MARILAIDDEQDLQEVLDYNLRQAGHEVLAALSGAAGLAIARQKRPDLVLLDLMLPDLSGTEVCKMLKQDPWTRGAAVVMVTAKSEEIDRVLGFELGADDYLTKPFSMRELLLRIQAVLRRAAGEPELTVVQVGALRIDRGAHRVSVGERSVVLTPTEFKLLALLSQRRDRVQSRATLLDEVWGIDGDVSTRTVDTHVKRLREKLEEAGRYIETVRGTGYRFAGSEVDR
jgi:two-component system, OmpR family, phosphate regulon response regulator PhoB